MITQKIEDLASAKFLGTFELHSPEWHEARSGIGGSDIGAIMGVSPWKSAYTIWAEKSGKISDSIEATLPMQLGNAFEPAIRNFFAEKNKDWLQVHETGTWQSLENPLFKANPDGIIEWHDGQLGILEIKFTRQYWNELPLMYEFQVLWYMYVLGLKKAVVCAVTGGDYREFEVVWDDSLIEGIKTAVRGFCDLIDCDKAPDWDGSDSTYQTVRQLSPGLEEGEIELGKLYSDLIATKSEFEMLENMLNAQKSAILAFMNGIKVGTYQGEKVITLQARNGKPFITFAK